MTDQAKLDWRMTTEQAKLDWRTAPSEIPRPFQEQTALAGNSIEARLASVGCELLKSMAHEGRLVILYLLSIRERSVSELEATLDMRQPAVSQQLARLRSDNIVSTRRDGKMVYYSLASDQARAVVGLLSNLCGHAG